MTESTWKGVAIGLLVAVGLQASWQVFGIAVAALGWLWWMNRQDDNTADTVGAAAPPGGPAFTVASSGAA